MIEPLVLSMSTSILAATSATTKTAPNAPKVQKAKEQE